MPCLSSTTTVRLPGGKISTAWMPEVDCVVNRASSLLCAVKHDAIARLGLGGSSSLVCVCRCRCYADALNDTTSISCATLRVRKRSIPRTRCGFLSRCNAVVVSRQVVCARAQSQSPRLNCEETWLVARAQRAQSCWSDGNVDESRKHARCIHDSLYATLSSRQFCPLRHLDSGHLVTLSRATLPG